MISSIATLRGRIAGVPEVLSSGGQIRSLQAVQGLEVWHSGRTTLVRNPEKGIWSVGQTLRDELRMRPDHPRHLLVMSGASDGLTSVEGTLSLGDRGEVRLANFQGALTLATQEDGVVLLDGDNKVIAGPTWTPVDALSVHDSSLVFELPAGDLHRAKIVRERIGEILPRLGYSPEEFEGVYGDVLALDRWLRANHEPQGLEEVLAKAINAGCDRLFIDKYYERSDGAAERLFLNHKRRDPTLYRRTDDREAIEPLQVFDDVATLDAKVLEKLAKAGLTVQELMEPVLSAFITLEGEAESLKDAAASVNYSLDTYLKLRRLLGDNALNEDELRMIGREGENHHAIDEVSDNITAFTEAVIILRARSATPAQIESIITNTVGLSIRLEFLNASNQLLYFLINNPNVEIGVLEERLSAAQDYPDLEGDSKYLGRILSGGDSTLNDGSEEFDDRIPPLY